MAGTRHTAFYKSMIGLKRGTVKLVPYNPKWKQSFEREAKKIRYVFREDVLRLEHVGSTAISGILAKPIIDIALAVPSLQKARRYTQKLKAIGFELKKNDLRAERLFFTKGPEKKRTHYLHIGEMGSDYVEDMILFRDYLCLHPGAAKKYSELKSKLAGKYHNTREIYTAKKEKRVKDIIKKAKNISCKVGTRRGAFLRLKFRHHLVEEIMAGRKTVTWRLFDDKDLKAGDKIELIDWESREKFAEAEIIKIREKELGGIEEKDFIGHEKFESKKEMLETYRKYYGDKVDWNTIVKIIEFKLIFDK